MNGKLTFHRHRHSTQGQDPIQDVRFNKCIDYIYMLYIEILKGKTSRGAAPDGLGGSGAEGVVVRPLHEL